MRHSSILQGTWVSLSEIIMNQMVREDNADGRDPNRHLGLAIRRLAKAVLSGRPGPAARAGVPQPSHEFGGGQWHVLFAAAANLLWPLVRRDADGLLFRRQGWPLHHPREAPA